MKIKQKYIRQLPTICRFSQGGLALAPFFVLKKNDPSSHLEQMPHHQAAPGVPRAFGIEQDENWETHGGFLELNFKKTRSDIAQTNIYIYVYWNYHSFLPGFVLTWPLAKRLSGLTSSDSKTRIQSGIRPLLASDASFIGGLWVTRLDCSPQPATITRITKQDAYPGALFMWNQGQIWKTPGSKYSQFGSSSWQV